MIVIPAWQSWALRGVPFTPASLGASLLAWLESKDVAAVLTKAAQPTPVDWDMETAGTGAWTAVDATLSKQGSAYAGSQCLRVAKLVGNVPYCSQAALLAGNRCSLSVRTRSNGAGVPRLSVVGGQIDGTTSTAWQLLQLEATAGGTSFYLQSNSATAGQYSEFDEFTATNISRVKWDKTAGTLTVFASNANAAQQPWWSASTGFVWFSKASGDGLPLSAKVDQLHAATNTCSYFATIYPDSTATGVDVILGNVEATSDFGVNLQYDHANQRIDLVISDNTGAYQTVSSANGSVPRNAKYIVEYHRNLTAISIVCNGVEIATGTGTKFSATTATRVPCVGNTSTGAASTTNGMNGGIGAQVLCAGATALSAGQKLSTRQYLAVQPGITL